MAFQSAAVGSKQRRHFGVGDCRRHHTAIDDPSPQPVAPIRYCEKMFAVLHDSNPGQPAKIGILGFQDETAAKGEGAKFRAVRLLRIKRGDRLGPDVYTFDGVSGDRWLYDGREREQSPTGGEYF